MSSFETSDGYSFRDLSLVQRKALSARISSMFPERYPIILLPNKSSNLPRLKKYKILSPKDITIVKLNLEIQKQFENNSDEYGNSQRTIFLSVNRTMLLGSDLLNRIYERHADEDGFLYITISSENTFG